MKKYIFGVALALALVVAPCLSFAQTSGVAPCPSINKDLTVGSTGPDVTALQKYLIEEGLLNIEGGGPTGYFGDLTKAAVIRWQTDHNILNETGFGPLSRAALASLCPSSKWSARLDKIVTPTSLILPGNWFRVRGARLTNDVTIRSNQGDLQALYKPAQAIVSGTGNTFLDLKLATTTPVGTYELFVKGTNGKNSNIVALVVTGEPKVVSVVASTTEGIFPGSWVKVRGERLSTMVNWYNLTGMSGDTHIGGAKANAYPVLGARLTDLSRRLDFKIDPREAPGTYEIGVVGEWGNSNKIPFVISPRPNSQVCVDIATPGCAITLLAPVGGESLSIGSTYNVRNTNLSGNYNRMISYNLYKDGVKLGHLVGTNHNDESFEWRVGQYTDETVNQTKTVNSGSYKIGLITPGLSSPIFSGSFSLTSGQDIPAPCTETDGGINYEVKGDTTGPASDGSGEIVTLHDHCVDSSRLNEAGCASFGAGWYLKTCTNGCSDGACLPVPVSVRPRIEGNVLEGVTNTWLRIRGARLTNNVLVRKYGDPESVTTPLPGGVVSGVSGNEAAFLDVKLAIPVGSYHLYVIGADGSRNTEVKLKVVAAKTSQAKSSQIAAVASALQALIDQLKAQ